jgi:predicted DNA-binding helix-hairpin-helix protein
MKSLDTEGKLALLGHEARHDLCGTSPLKASRKGQSKRRIPPGLYPAVLPNGRVACLFKVLLTNECANDCAYCQNRLGGRHRNASFSPEEMARAFIGLNRRGIVHGLFLSSGVPGNPDEAMKEIVDTLEILRGRYEYRGYIHAKVLPGCSRAAVERACELADRASINLEFPNQERLALASRCKNYDAGLMSRLAWLGEIHRGGLLRSGLTTQFVVGAAGESDGEIISVLSHIYHDHSLRRAYFSSFNPLAGTPWEDKPPASSLREHRLYQADFLHRLYGFDWKDIPLDKDGSLPLDKDPKLAWALLHPEEFPREVNRASIEELLRIPGIGHKSAERIVAAREEAKLKDLGQLRVLGAVASRAAPFVLLDGRKPPSLPIKESPQQLTLWEALQEAG